MNIFFITLFIIILILAVIIPVMLKLCYIPVMQNTAVILQKTSTAKESTPQKPLVLFYGRYLNPYFHSKAYKKTVVELPLLTIEFDLCGKNSMRCKDFIRADIKLVFYMQLDRAPDQILWAINTLGTNQVADSQSVKEYFKPLIMQILRTEVEKRDFEELFTNRGVFCQSVMHSIANHLEGYELFDISIDHLDQTPLSELDPENFEDAQAIAKIEAHQAWLQLETQRMELAKAQAIAKKDAETQWAIAELERQQKESLEKTQK